MDYIADLHIHSPFSRATSKAGTLQGLAAWAAVKGIRVIGTGDFTHPGWFAQISEQLMEAEPGFFRLRPEWSAVPDILPGELAGRVSLAEVRFVLSAEISSIYKKGERVRKNHNLLYAPDLAAVQRINRRLADIGNLHSDGRPILGLDARNLLEIVLEEAPDGFLVPAHIWTPWFSLFGSKSGFDRLEECFEDLSPHIFALETGLSSDPEMNRRISALDRYTLISNSDCHSPAKLGREANLLATAFDYYHLQEALRQPCDSDGNQVFRATVEFYPEEGKYHCDGHRKCGVCFEPRQTAGHQGCCPECGKPLTIGVLNRVMALADRDVPRYPSGSPAVLSCIPLAEVLSELLGVGPATKKVAAAYAKLITLFGSEFALLLEVPVEEISSRATPLIAEAIRRIRSQEVIRQPGFDGEFGVIRVFDPGERASLAGQMKLFAPLPTRRRRSSAGKAVKAKAAVIKEALNAKPLAGDAPLPVLNREQQQAVDSRAPVIVVKAGPGTGKTHALVQRVVRVAGASGAGRLPRCTVISFTNKAVDEVRERIAAQLGKNQRIQVWTFHGYCLHWLRRQQPGLQVVGAERREQLLGQLLPSTAPLQRLQAGRELCQYLENPSTAPPTGVVSDYLAHLEAENGVDIQAIVPAGVELLSGGGAVAEEMRRATDQLLVDEFQDINLAQYRLVTELAKSSSIFVIGDPDQAIYGFRGANARWFQEFGLVQRAEIHQLVRNYRSGSVILGAAEALIRHNRRPGETAPMQSLAGRSGRVHLRECRNPEEEARWIGDRLEQLLGGTSHRSIEQLELAEESTISLKDIGILFRTSSQKRAVAALLERRSIPFQVVDLEAFYTRGDTRLLYLSLLALAGLAEPEQELLLFARQSGVGPVMRQQVAAALQQAAAQESRPPQGEPPTLLSLDPASLSRPRAREHLARFQGSLGRLQARARQAGSALIPILEELICFHGLELEDEDNQRLLQLARSYGASLEGFAGYLQRYSDSLLYDQGAECVTLSTLHAAKGLEFKVVFLTGVEEGILPLEPRETLAQEALEELIEEERRLCYVGITRAIESLHLSWCRSRLAYDHSSGRQQPSRFIGEIPAQLLTPLAAPLSRQRSAHRQLSLFPSR
ncbi:UvrD-helicase domain-containing protein [Desulfogranum mediterraneum]|uniref:UvrD-helicase domain-containing protein n=1 Tax=Desulfogranum mediterraneum TaxID=160661 RepID=UPI0004069C96|nr:UvrD-helicase domain-containing protein [Desulfogranum mediterraneum]